MYSPHFVNPQQGTPNFRKLPYPKIMSILSPSKVYRILDYTYGWSSVELHAISHRGLNSLPESQKGGSSGSEGKVRSLRRAERCRNCKGVV